MADTHEDIADCEYVTLEGLRLLCDAVYKNGALSKQDAEVIYADGGDILGFVRYADKKIRKNFILVTGGTDITVPLEALTKEQTRRFLAHPFLVKWFAQNLLFVHEKTANWPLGFSFKLLREKSLVPVSALAQERKLKALAAAARPFYERASEEGPLVFVNMTMRNGRLESRWDAFNALYLKDPSLLVDAEAVLAKLEANTETPRDDVWRSIAGAPFCLSPFGYGIDCHRNYEILALGAIPIIRGRILEDLFVGMPVLYVDRWEDVTRKLLQRTLKEFSEKKFDYSRLTVAYWRGRLRV